MKKTKFSNALPVEGNEEELIAIERSEKILQYEKFIEERLKVDLKLVLDSKEKLVHKLSQYRQLRDTILLIQNNHLETLKTQLELSSEFFVHAQIEDTKKVYVDIGYGFHVEFTLVEALEVIAKKESALLEYCAELDDKAADIQTHIKLVYEGINRLLELGEPKKPHRVF